MTETPKSPAAKRSALNFETVASVVAMLVGVSALFVAWDQAQIMRKQQHASVLPVLNVAGGLSSAGERHILTISVGNDGIGPAVIESAELLIDETPIESWPDLRDKFFPDALHSDYESSLDTAIGILAAGEKMDAIILTWPRNDETDVGFEALKQRVFVSDVGGAFFRVCYCSVFDRCWRNARDNSAKPEPVKRCEAAGEDVVARLLQTISTDEKT